MTAISTSPDLQWLVQPTLVSSVAPSQTRAPHPYGVPTSSAGAYSRAGVMKTMNGGRAQSIGRRGKVEQVSSQHLLWGGGRVASALVEVGSTADRVKPLMEMTRHPEWRAKPFPSQVRL